MGLITRSSMLNGPFRLREEGRRVEESKVKFVENRLILDYLYAAPLYSYPLPSIQTNCKLVSIVSFLERKQGFSFSFFLYHEHLP